MLVLLTQVENSCQAPASPHLSSPSSNPQDVTCPHQCQATSGLCAASTGQPPTCRLQGLHPAACARLPAVSAVGGLSPEHSQHLPRWSFSGGSWLVYFICFPLCSIS